MILRVPVQILTVKTGVTHVPYTSSYFFALRRLLLLRTIVPTLANPVPSSSIVVGSGNAVNLGAETVVRR